MDSTVLKPDRVSIIQSIRNKISVNLLPVLILACCTSLTSILGMIIHGAYTNMRGPVWIRNHYIGLWLTSVMLFFSFQTFYSIFKSIKKSGKCFHYTELVYFSIGILASIILTICYAMAYKADAVIWSFLIGVICSLNIYVLVIRSKPVFASIENADDTISKNTMIDNTQVVNKHAERCVNALIVINIILRCLFIAFVVLLTNGSVFIGGMTATYPPRGKFVSVPLSDNSGRYMKIHYLCDGPINNSFPIYMFEGSGSHGLADYLGIQMLLKEKNRRSCIWDKPGLGYSDYLYSDMYTDFTLVYHNFFKAIGEKSPFIFVGWGGGGATVYKYALSHPEMVYSITFLDVSPAGVEWLVPKTLKNWNESYYQQYIASDIASRTSLFNIINGLGVPWGLMQIFVPLGSSYPTSLRSEVNWYFLTDKTWTTQYYFLLALTNETDSYSTSLQKGITLNHITTVYSDTQVVNKTCTPRNLDVSSSDCQYNIAANKKLIELRMQMVPYNTVINCTADACGLDYYIYTGPQYTVENLMNLYVNASI